MGGPIIEAEKYDKNSPITPFVIQAGVGGMEYIVATAGDLTVPTEASNTAQALYSFKATATQVTVYATVNLATADTDSFHYQIGGLAPWATKNGMATAGFQEILLMTVSNAIVGQTYVLKIQRREAGAQFDKFRLIGGLFVDGAAAATPLLPANLSAGKIAFDGHCADCHGSKGTTGGQNGGAILTDANRNNLVKIINDTMPKTDPSLCKGQCAVDVAGYILNGYSDVPKVVPSTCTNPNWLFCDDFESYTSGMHPTAPWLPYMSGDHVNTNMWTVETTEVRATSGKKSVHFGIATNGRAFMLLKAPFPMPNNTFYGRMMMYLQKVPGNAHFDYVSAYDGIKESNNNYVWGGQFGKTMANYHPGDCYKHYDGAPTAGKWQCVEWKFDGPKHQMDLWIDDVNQTGANHSVITNGQGGSGCGTWAPPTSFGALTIGWAHYQASDVGNNSWIDDLVLDDQRIGCPQAQ